MNNFTHRYELLNDSKRGKRDERCLLESWKKISNLGLQKYEYTIIAWTPFQN